MTAVAFRGRWGPSSQPTGSSYVTFTYDQIAVDTHGFHSGSGLITIPQTGIYLIHASWSGNGNTSRTIQVRQNGTSIRGNAMGANTGGIPFTSTAHWVGCLTEGDQIDVRGSSTLTVATTFGFTHITRIPLPFVHALQNGDVTGANKLPWATTSDIEGWHDPGDPTKFTVTDTADYIVSFTGRSVGGDIVIWVYINGSPTVYYAAGAGFDRDPHIHCLLSLTAGDDVEVHVDSSAVTDDRDGNPNHFTMWQLPTTAAYVQARQASSTTTNVDGTRWPLTLEDADTSGFHSTSTNNTRLTVPSGKAGTYLIWGGLYMNYGVAVGGNLRINGGATFALIGDYALWPGGSRSPNTCAVYNLAVGDYVELEVYTGSTGQTAVDARLGMARLDDLTYVPQVCPGDPVTFVPQIVRYR